MTGSLSLHAGASLIRRIDGSATVPNTNNGATLMIPAGAFATTGNRFLVFPTIPNVAQVQSSFTSSNEAETLMAGGGPSAFAWCPRTNFGCTNQTNPGGDAGFLGLVEYRTGNSFGGTFRVLRNINPGTISRVVGTSPIQVNHQPSTDPNPWAGGQGCAPLGPGCPALFTQNDGPVPQGVLTQNPVLGPNGSIQTQGTVVPGGGLFQPTAFETGFPATTGQIFLQDSIGFGQATFTMTGSDNRNANGHGTITLVASGYSNNLAAEVFPLRLTVTMNLGPTVPTMGAWGIASLGILVVLAAGYALRRRL